jgi:hypothetical protein
MVQVQAGAAGFAGREAGRGMMQAREGDALGPRIVGIIEVGRPTLGVVEQYGGTWALGQDGGGEQRAIPSGNWGGNGDTGRIEVSEERGFPGGVGGTAGAVARQAQHEAFGGLRGDQVGVVEAAVQ